MMTHKWFLAAAAVIVLGIFTAGIRLVGPTTAAAESSDPVKDVQKGDKSANKNGQTKPVEAKIFSGNHARQLRDKLDQLVTIEFEPNTPLREAISFIAQRYDMTVLIEKDIFQAAHEQPDVENQPVKLPKLVDVKLVTALRAIVQQVQGDFYTKEDVLMVVPGSFIASGRILKQPVDVGFDKRPLAEALKELSDMTGVSVVLDPRGQDDAKLVVTADLRNVPLDSAVRVLADMTGMKSFVVDNLIYVTSIANVDKLEEEAAQKRGQAPANWEKTISKKKK